MMKFTIPRLKSPGDSFSWCEANYFLLVIPVPSLSGSRYYTMSFLLTTRLDLPHETSLRAAVFPILRGFHGTIT